MRTRPIFDPSRRGVLRSLVGGSVLLPGIVSQLLAEDAAPAPPVNPLLVDPLAPKPAHIRPKAQKVIFLYMSGGVSHVESFYSKPKLFADAGKTVSVDEF